MAPASTGGSCAADSTERGPAAAWVRPTVPLLDGYERCPGWPRVVLIADSASGISAELDWATWSFVNVDLDVHLARPVEGDWLLHGRRTQLGPRRLGAGPLDPVRRPRRGGAGLQTLVARRLMRPSHLTTCVEVSLRPRLDGTS